jgi:hypothetical protein
MAIWEFTQFEDDALIEISVAVGTLEQHGIEQDEDMVREIDAEMSKRGLDE